MVEGAALEMLFRGNFNEGSNPSLSVPNSILVRLRQDSSDLESLFYIERITSRWIILDVFQLLLIMD